MDVKYMKYTNEQLLHTTADETSQCVLCIILLCFTYIPWTFKLTFHKPIHLFKAMLKLNLTVILICLQIKHYTQNRNLNDLKDLKIFSKYNRTLWLHSFAQKRSPGKFFWTRQNNRTITIKLVDPLLLTAKNWGFRFLPAFFRHEH